MKIPNTNWMDYDPGDGCTRLPREARIVPNYQPNAYSIIITDGDCAPRRYRRYHYSPSVARLDRVIKNADPCSNGISVSVTLLEGPEIILRRAGVYVEKWQDEGWNTL
jgi:hypothetical protein